MGQAKVTMEDHPAAPSPEGRPGTRRVKEFLAYVGPALMVSIAYMDPGNYGTDVAAGAGFRYELIWAVWLASGMAMLLQYLSGKLGIATGRSLPELVRESLVRRAFVVPYWLAAEAAAAATDLAEYLGTVVALNLLFGIPLLYAAIFGALDVILIMTMMSRRYKAIEQMFGVLVGVLVLGFLYQLIAVKPSLEQVAVHSVTISTMGNDAVLLVVGIIGATVMPHALFVHSWLTKHKMELTGNKAGGGGFSEAERHRTLNLHKWETILMLAMAGIVNVGILLVAIPLYPDVNITIGQAVARLGQIFGPLVGIVFVVTLLASGLSASTLGTISGQIVMEGLIGSRWNVWARRAVTRVINVFPTTVAVLLGIDPLHLLVYSQVVLSLLIPLPMIPLVYYTSRRRLMGEFVNRRVTVAAALVAGALILAFNSYLIASSL